jgi:putative membrane protein
MRLRVWIAGAALLWVPLAMSAQVDPAANQNGVQGASPYGQQPGMSQAGPANQNGTQAGQPSSMRDSLGAPGLTGQQMRDDEFLRAAAETGIADVKMGTLATEKGGPEVKPLAQKLVDDHATINKEMDAVADQLGVMLPKKMNKEQQAEYEKLNGLSGKDFDTEYLTYLTKTHWQHLHSFHMEASAAADPGLQAEAVKVMMSMHEHLGMINKAATDEGIILPARPPRPQPQTVAKQ